VSVLIKVYVSSIADYHMFLTSNLPAFYPKTPNHFCPALKYLRIAVDIRSDNQFYAQVKNRADAHIGARKE
jgi:hypothetical protein